MKQYLDLCNHILTNGRRKMDRTGTGTIGVFGYQMRFDLMSGFPLLTTKKVHLKSIIHELLWFLQGSTNIKYLKENGVRIWDEWADENGELGPVYGSQWRKWVDVRFTPKMDDDDEIKGFGFCGELRDSNSNPSDVISREIDQIKNLIEGLKKNPFSRRHIVTAWNPSVVEEQALPPCHSLFQFYAEELTQAERAKWVETNLKTEYDSIQEILIKEINEGKFRDPSAEPGIISDLTCDSLIERAGELFSRVEGVPKYRLSCQLYQRSADTFLGVPFNIASYALLTMMVAQCVDMVPGDFVWTGGDTHIYLNHLDQIKEQMSREPKALPKMKINPFVKDIFSFKYEDFELEGYDPHPPIKGEVSV